MHIHAPTYTHTHPCVHPNSGLWREKNEQISALSLSTCFIACSVKLTASETCRERDLCPGRRKMKIIKQKLMHSSHSQQILPKVFLFVFWFDVVCCFYSNTLCHIHPTSSAFCCCFLFCIAFCSVNFTTKEMFKKNKNNTSLAFLIIRYHFFNKSL